MRLKNIREDKDITQLQIATLLNCKQNTYQQYETGKRQIPLEALKKLAFFYNTSVDYLLEITDETKPYPRKNNIKK
ncbi:MAG: helix-turn-helix transcriptional regulator [Clostridia bacterium]|nr:helix-turn-helix transcriptional regulator [Clostridia bacterium]